MSEFEQKIEKNKQNKDFTNESIDYLITRILTILTETRDKDSVRKIDFMPTEEIHKSIQSLEKLFNIKHNLIEK